MIRASQKLAGAALMQGAFYKCSGYTCNGLTKNKKHTFLCEISQNAAIRVIYIWKLIWAVWKMIESLLIYKHCNFVLIQHVDMLVDDRTDDQFN